MIEIQLRRLPHGEGLPLPARASERIAQLVPAPVLQADFAEVAELSETSRGAGGFGSTGQ